MVAAYDVSGVTRLSVDEVERLVYPHEGPDRTQADVEAARKALQDAYAARGYGAALVDLPVQDHDSFAQGILHIAVNEAPVGRLRVTGSKYHALSVAREQIPALAEGEPVNMNKLQAQISVANRFPDRLIDPQFKPGRVPGEIDVDLKVTDQRPLHGSVELDNDASPSTTPLRLSASVRYTNLFQTGQTLSLTYVVAPENPKETQVIAGSYTIPILNSPWSVSISGYDSNSNVGSLGGSAVLGDGFQVGARLIYRLPSTSISQSFSFGPDFKDFKQKIVVGSTVASSAPITYVPVEMQYMLAGATEHATYDLAAGATFGLRAIKQVVCVTVTNGICTYGDAFQNREQSSYENFVHGNLTVDYNYAFTSDVVAAFRMTGQLADTHLITNEQFSGGGAQSVRGYYSSEAVGDNGIAPSLEMRSPSLAAHFGHWLSEARFYGFADAAFIKVKLPASTSLRTGYKLFGVGGGLRVRIFDKLSGDIFVGVPLLDGPTTTAGNPRVSFQVKGEF